jgi:adenylate cyclase
MGRARRPLSAHARRAIPAPAAVVFGVVADTNRWDRLLGWTPTTYAREAVDPRDPATTRRIGTARYLGREIRFAEDGDWWSGQFLRGERHFVGRAARLWRYGHLEVRVEPDGDDRSIADLTVLLQPAGVVGWLVAALSLIMIRVKLGLYLRAVARALRGRSAAADPDAPAFVQARTALLAAAGDEGRVTGKARAVGQTALGARTARFAEAPVSDEVKRRIVDHLVEQPDEALHGIEPFMLARAWGEDRREVLRGFLHATHAGLYRLSWQVDCPTCRVGSAQATRLEAVARRVHCDVCEISFDVDFAEHVHAVFEPDPAIRAIDDVVYCAGSPAFRPHVHGHLQLAPGERREVGPLPDGPLLLRTRGTVRSLRVDAPAGGIAVRIAPTAIEATDGAAPGRLTVVNQADQEVRLFVERAGWSVDRARGSLLVTLPDFVDLFGTEAPAAGLPMSVGTVAVLFTDVVGSVALYDRVGDARAYALIQEHWRVAMEEVAAAGGSVIKTLGDGMMASFAGVAVAARTAAAIMRRSDALAAGRDVALVLRAGAHEGPCYVVRGNDRLDLFGTTVNLAARLCGIAGGHQIAVLADGDRPAALTGLAADDCTIETVRHGIRGLPGEHVVALVTVPGGEAATGPRVAARPGTAPPGRPAPRAAE